MLHISTLGELQNLHLLCHALEHQIEITKTARYFTAGNPKANTLMVVLHGYGQLAEFFIQKFKDFEDDYYILAPEGLHRFYVNGTHGRVGASWMTKESRETDIKDYIKFLEDVLKKASESLNYNKFVILGFSQGVASMFRWIANGNVHPNHCIIASGMIPPDLKVSLNHPAFANIKWTYLTGDNDPYRNDEEVQSFIDLFESHQIPLKQIEFSGGHSIDNNAVKQALTS